ncbi:hypothetical protein GGR58DRAFT_227295 [Xylaria digitata]|nr:hypothetical protein GGR58DRAFT_227295 [Xylaria digitata]
MPSENQISWNGGISKEIELLKEVKDILDELNIINTVLIRQKNTMKTVSSGLENCDVKGALLDHHYIFSKIEHTSDEVERLIYDAKQIQKKMQINHLLDLRQKDANLSEAIWARNSAENTARQGRTILVFTAVTIIFLPITFLSSLFVLNITSFPHDAEGMLSYNPEWAFSRLFGITIAVSVPLIILAFFMGQISEFSIAFLNMRAYKKGNRKFQGVPDDEADNMTKVAMSSAGRGEDAGTTWRGRILRRRWRRHPVRGNISGV